MIEREIEVFRAGTAAARGITPEQLSEVATFDCAANPIGICFGHPKSDDPAAGTISKFRAAGNSLFATVKTLTDKAVDGIKADAWLNRSMAFFDPTHEANPRPGKWSPRHLGLLGASAPGIPGMGSLKKALAFDADGGLVTEGDPADAVIYAGRPTDAHFVFESKEPDMDPKDAKTPTAEDLATRSGALDTRESEFSARVKRQFDASNGSAIDALVREGKVLPAEVDGLKLAFGAFDAEGEELTFGAGDKTTKATAASHLLAFMASALPARVDVSGKRQSPDTAFSAKDTDTSDPQAAARKLTADARALMAKDSSLTFEAAIDAVSGDA